MSLNLSQLAKHLIELKILHIISMIEKVLKHL